MRTSGKAAQQVERGGALVVRLQHAVRVGHARLRCKLLAVDNVAPAATQAPLWLSVVVSQTVQQQKGAGQCLAGRR